MLSWLLMSSAQARSLLELGVAGQMVPRAITNAQMAGLWACPFDLLDDPKYAEWAQGLSYLPLRTTSSEALFT